MDIEKVALVSGRIEKNNGRVRVTMNAPRDHVGACSSLAVSGFKTSVRRAFDLAAERLIEDAADLFGDPVYNDNGTRIDL